MVNPIYLYRGTTEGWPGSKMLQDERITCTTTDPFVATLFGIECRNHGRAVILIARRELFRELRSGPNYFSAIEAAVDLEIVPAEFERVAGIRLDVGRSIEILREIGIQDIPVRLAGYAALQQELEDTHSAGCRLNADQIVLFDNLVIERSK